MIPKWLEDFVKAGSARIRTIVRSGRPLELAGDAGPSHQVQSLFMQHYGFRSRPGPGTEVATVAILANANQRMGVASEAPGTGPADQEDWEVEIYSKAGQRIRLRADGSTVLQVASGAQAQLRTDGSVLLVDASGGTAQLKNGVLTVGSDVARRHDLGTGAAPTTVISAIATAASPGTALFGAATGTDRLFRVSVTIGANNISAGVELFISTFGASLSGAMAQATTEDGTKCGATASTTQVKVKAGETLGAGSTYVFVVSTGGVA